MKEQYIPSFYSSKDKVKISKDGTILQNGKPTLGTNEKLYATKLEE